MDRKNSKEYSKFRRAGKQINTYGYFGGVSIQGDNCRTQINNY